MASWFIVELTSEPVINYIDSAEISFEANTGFDADIPPLVDPTTQGGQGAYPFMHGGGAPAFEKDKFVVAGSTSLFRSTKGFFGGQVDLRRSLKSEFSANMELQRKREIQFAMDREPAHHYLQLVREDEEILLWL